MIGYGARIEERYMMNNFEKELEKIVEDRVNKLVSKSDARDISEFARDEVVVARLDRTYDSKDLLMLLHDAFEDDCELEERVDKYGLKTKYSNSAYLYFKSYISHILSTCFETFFNTSNTAKLFISFSSVICSH